MLSPQSHRGSRYHLNIHGGGGRRPILRPKRRRSLERFVSNDWMGLDFLALLVAQTPRLVRTDSGGIDLVALTTPLQHYHEFRPQSSSRFHTR